ncbi:VaFE repeat-containing surface-anchored protein [Microbacterium tumbae]
MRTRTSTTSGRWGRGLAAVLLGVAAVVPAAIASAAAAEIDPGDTVWIGGSVGYGGTSIHPVYAEAPADPDDPGATGLWAYCIEHDISARTFTDAVAGDYASYLGDNHFTDPVIQAKVHWVLTHSFPALGLTELGAAAGVADLSVDDAVEATQYAIWRYTDLDFDAAWSWETPDSEAVYWYLVNGANADTALSPPAPAPVEVSVTAPAASGTAGVLYGPFIVSTNQATASVAADPAYPITDGAGTAVDIDAVVDGQELYLDLRGETAAGSATISATVDGAEGTGLVISVPVSGSTAPTEDAHAQSIILVAAAEATTTASAEGAWLAAVDPAIGTTLVDSADQDHALAWNGGTVVDTIVYAGLTPGQPYTVAGDLLLQADGSGTGITGTTTFTPTAADGTVEVAFTVPIGYAGESLVAFERLYEGSAAAGEPVAEHADIEDAAQTVTVEEEPVVTVPAIGTSLVDDADQDHDLVWSGGTVIDTIAYQNLTPGTEYTVAGELMLQSDGSATGITGSTTFTPTEANGSVEVVFAVPAGYAGESLVAFEHLYEGSAAEGEPVAEHTDIEDAAQTVAVEERPVVPAAPGDDGGLALTGAVLPVGLLGLGVLVLVAGAVLIAARRRERERELG